MSNNSGSDLPSRKTDETDEILEEFQCVSYELRKIAENPEFKYFGSERFRKKMESIVREEYYYLIKSDPKTLEKDKNKESSTLSKLFNNSIRG